MPSFLYLDFTACYGAFVRKDMVTDRRYADEVAVTDDDLKPFLQLLRYQRLDALGFAENENNYRDYRFFIRLGAREIFVTSQGCVEDSVAGKYALTPFVFLSLWQWVESCALIDARRKAAKPTTRKKSR